MLKMTLKNEKTGAVGTKMIANGDYKNFENIAKGVVREWSRKVVREEWIASGKLIVGDRIGEARFADGFDSAAMGTAVAEFEKNVSWIIDEA